MGQPVFRKIETGNGEPELWAAEHDRACWADRSPVLDIECEDTPANRSAAKLRHGLSDDSAFDLNLVGHIVRRNHLKVASAESAWRSGWNELPKIYGCAECGCTDIQCTAWIEFNSGKVVEGDGPDDDVWCPRCEQNDCRTKEVDILDPHKPDIDELRHK